MFTWDSRLSERKRYRNSIVSIERNHFLNSSLKPSQNNGKQKLCRNYGRERSKLTFYSTQGAEQSEILYPCSPPQMPVGVSCVFSTIL